MDNANSLAPPQPVGFDLPRQQRATVARIAFWVAYHRSSAHRGIGAPGMMLSTLVSLYVSSRFGFEIAGPVGAIGPLVLFGPRNDGGDIPG